jgi:hypothetical protein
LVDRRDDYKTILLELLQHVARPTRHGPALRHRQQQRTQRSAFQLGRQGVVHAGIEARVLPGRIRRWFEWLLAH